MSRSLPPSVLTVLRDGLRYLFLDSCSWVMDSYELYKKIKTRALGITEDSYEQLPDAERLNELFARFSIYHYIMFSEPVSKGLSPEKIESLIVTYGGSDEENIRSFVNDINSLKLESLARTINMCEEVGNLKLIELEGIEKEVKKWLNSFDERLRKIANMTLAEFMSSEEWEEIIEDKEVFLEVMGFSKGKFTDAIAAWTYVSNVPILNEYLGEEILRLLRRAGLARKGTSWKIVEQHCLDLKCDPECATTYGSCVGL